MNIEYINHQVLNKCERGKENLGSHGIEEKKKQKFYRLPNSKCTNIKYQTRYKWINQRRITDNQHIYHLLRGPIEKDKKGSESIAL